MGGAVGAISARCKVHENLIEAAAFHRHVVQ